MVTDFVGLNRDYTVAEKNLEETKSFFDVTHLNNFMDTAEHDEDVTIVDETVTHRITDFDKLLDGKSSILPSDWIGSSYGSSPKGDDGRMPLVLVHGWNGDPGMTDPSKLLLWENAEYHYWHNFLAYYLTSEELQKKYHIYLYRYTSYKHVSYSAKVFEELLNEVSSTTDLGKGLEKDEEGITIMAHSMGGMVSRAMIEEYEGLGENAEKLKKLITLDTPHRGSIGSMDHLLANLPKDLGTHGAMDLNYDNFDNRFNASELRKNYNQRRSDNGLDDFDTTYCQKLRHTLSSCRDITANPYMKYLNDELFQEKYNIYNKKYIFYTAWHVHDYDSYTKYIYALSLIRPTLGLRAKKIQEQILDLSKNNNPKLDFINNGVMGISTAFIGNYGYAAGGAETVGSSILASSTDGETFNPKDSTFSSYSSESTNDLYHKDLTLDTVCIEYAPGMLNSEEESDLECTKTKDISISLITDSTGEDHYYGVPYRLFWEYDHETIFNGTAKSRGAWDTYITSTTDNGGSSDDTVFNSHRADYIQGAMKIRYGQEPENVSDSYSNSLNPLKYEPVFLTIEKDLLYSVTNGDIDEDKLPDIWEEENGLRWVDASDALKDSDNDGLTNLQEYNNGKDGTDPQNEDSDGDGFKDGVEVTEGTDPNDKADYPIINTPPTANAGEDQTITFGETVTLDASGSTDDKKESLTYTWSWKSDVDDSPLEKEAESFEVAGLSVGEHTFTLTVTDSDGEVDSDEVKIIVNKNIVRTITYQAKNTYRTFDDGRTDLQESISFQKEYDKLLFMGTENGKLIVLDAQTLEEKSKVVIDVDEFAYIDAKVDYIYKYGDDIYVSLNVKPSSLDGYDADMYIAQYKMKDNQIDSFTRLFKLRSDPSNGRSDGGPITGMHIYGDYLYLTAGGSVASYNLSETPIKEVKYSWIYGGVKNLCGIGNKVYVYGNPSANSYAISKYSIDKGEYTYEKSIDTKSLSEYDYRNKTLTCHDDKIFTAYGVLDEDLNVLVNTSNDSYWSIKGEKAYTIDYVYSKSSKTCDLKGMEVNLTNNFTSTIDITIDSDINSYEDCKNSSLLNIPLKYDSSYIATFSNSNSGEISVYSSTLNILKFYKTNGYINNISKNSNSVYVGTRLKILKMINNSTYKVLTTNSIFNKIGQAFGSFDVNDDYLLATTSYSSNDKNIHLFNLNSDSIELLYNGTAYYGGGRAKLCKDTILVSAMTYSASAAFDVVKIYNYNLEAEALSSRYFGTSYFTCDMNGMYYMNYSNYYAHTSTQLYKIIYSSENKRWEGNNILSRGGSFSPVYSDVNKISYLYRGSAYENEDKTSFVLNTIDDTNSTLTYGQDFPFKQESNEFIFYSEDGNEIKRVQSSCSPEYSINTVLKPYLSTQVPQTKKKYNT